MNYQGKELSIQKLKEMTYDELNHVSYAIRQEIIRLVAKHGGHLSSNLGAVELEIALIRFFDFPKDKLLIDVGHQSYAYKMLTGRDLNKLRQKGGVSGFQKRDESPYDVFEAGHSSTSLSAALGMAVARDLKKESFHVISLIGDASILNGMALEALNDIGSRKNKVIIVLNDNDMSVSKTVGALHKFASDSSVYEHFGLDYIGPIDGHNVEEIEAALAASLEHKNSVLIHTYTEKGKGYSFAEDDTLGVYHGISPFKVRTGEQISSYPHQISYSAFFGRLVDQAMQTHPEITLICPAMVLGSGLIDSYLKYPSRCFDVGIAEEHAVTLSAGMALQGLKPIVSIYSTFLQRALDQVSHDVARMHLPVLFLIDRSGLVGEDGETHQGLYDECFLLNTPNMVVAAPSDMSTAKALFQLGIQEKRHPFAIRYPRGYFAMEDEVKDEQLVFGKWRKEMKDSTHVGVITLGNLVVRLKRFFLERKISVNLYNALFLKPMDEEMLQDAMKNDHIFIINIMATRQGFVQNVIDYLVSHNYSGKIHSFAVKDAFITQGTLKEQLKDSGLDDESILFAITSALEEEKR